MFTPNPIPSYASRSAREIELEVRKVERQLALEQMLEDESEVKNNRKKTIFHALATILFS
jgi:hypothetical protein